MRIRSLVAVITCVLAPSAAFAQTSDTVEKPAALLSDGVPAIPAALAAETRPYMEFRTASFGGWNAADRSMLVSTRFGNTSQIHRVAMPMGAREQLSFEVEPVGGRWSPTGDLMVVAKDRGGDEFFQLYTLSEGRLTLLTDGGRSRNSFGAWSDDGRLIGYTSTRRNGRDSDLYVMDPRDASSTRMVAEVSGGGWDFAAFSPDGRSAVVVQYVQVTKSNLFSLDLASGRMAPIGDHSQSIAYGTVRFAPNGVLWATSDRDSDFQRLGRIDIATGAFTPVSTESRWDVEDFDISDDGGFIAYTVNLAGRSSLRLLDPSSGRVRTVDSLPAGIASGLDIAPWGDIGLTFSSARSASDAFSINAQTLAVTRWTRSETGGLDVTRNVEPELIEVVSFDGEAVSGFLYRPDPARFPGRRPLIINIHGGPEGQSRPGFMGRNNYLINELGIAIFFPNVRGSTGYGKRFVSLDNGPDLRENSVLDIGAFLDRFNGDAGIDPERVAITGGSYGGYMCYAGAIRYGPRLRGANCVVAISNFVTFLENTEAYRRDLRRVEYGDERDAAQRARLLEISPMTRVNELRIPLMVVTGGNDPRVPASEADQMIAAVRANGRTAWHLLGTDEGHGFAKKANQDYQFWANLLFWRETLLTD